MHHPTSYPEREREGERERVEEEDKNGPHFIDKYEKVGKKD